MPTRNNHLNASFDDTILPVFIRAFERLLDPTWRPESGRESPLVLHLRRITGASRLSMFVVNETARELMWTFPPGFLARFGLLLPDGADEETRIAVMASMVARLVQDEVALFGDDDGDGDDDDDPPPSGVARDLPGGKLTLLLLQAVVFQVVRSRTKAWKDGGAVDKKRSPMLADGFGADDLLTWLFTQYAAVIKRAHNALRNLPRLTPGMTEGEIVRVGGTVVGKLHAALWLAATQTSGDRDGARESFYKTVDKTIRRAATEVDVWQLTTDGVLSVGSPTALGPTEIRWKGLGGLERARAAHGVYKAWGAVFLLVEGEGVTIKGVYVANGSRVPMPSGPCHLGVPVTARVTLLEMDRPGYMDDEHRKVPLHLTRDPSLRTERLHPHIFEVARSQALAVPHTLNVGSFKEGCRIDGTPVSPGVWRSYVADNLNELHIIADDPDTRIALARPGRFRRGQRVTERRGRLKVTLTVEALGAIPLGTPWDYSSLEDATRHIQLPPTFMTTHSEAELSPAAIILFTEAIVNVDPTRPVPLSCLRRLLFTRSGYLSRPAGSMLSGISLVPRDSEDAVPNGVLERSQEFGRAAALDQAREIAAEIAHSHRGMLVGKQLREAILLHPAFQRLVRRHDGDAKFANALAEAIAPDPRPPTKDPEK